MKKVKTHRHVNRRAWVWFDSRPNPSDLLAKADYRIEKRGYIHPLPYSYWLFWRLFSRSFEAIVRSVSDRSTCPKKKVFGKTANRSSGEENRCILMARWDFHIPGAFFIGNGHNISFCSLLSSTMLAMSSAFSCGFHTRENDTGGRILRGHPWRRDHFLDLVIAETNTVAGNPIFIESCFVKNSWSGWHLEPLYAIANLARILKTVGSIKRWLPFYCRHALWPQNFIMIWALNLRYDYTRSNRRRPDFFPMMNRNKPQQGSRQSAKRKQGCYADRK